MLAKLKGKTAAQLNNESIQCVPANASMLEHEAVQNVAVAPHNQHKTLFFKCTFTDTLMESDPKQQ